VWGTDEPSHEIEIDERSYLVRDSLFAFLQQAQRQHTDRLLWIDAICIDQSNIRERNHQVRQMLDIYQKADFVLVWHGRDDTDIELLFAKITDNAWRFRILSRLQPQLPHPDQGSFPELKKLCASDYWSRLGIVPEILAARSLKVSAGDELVSWADLMSFTRCAPRLLRDTISLRNNIYASNLAALAKQKKFRRQRDGSYRFHELLFTHYKQKCSDPRDRVFALLAFSSDIDASRIRYQTTAKDLLFRVLRQAVPHRCKMDELAECLLGALELDACTDLLELPDYTTRATNLFYILLRKAPALHYDWPECNAIERMCKTLHLQASETDRCKQERAWQCLRTTLRLIYFIPSPSSAYNAASLLFWSLSLDASSRRCELPNYDSEARSLCMDFLYAQGNAQYTISYVIKLAKLLEVNGFSNITDEPGLAPGLQAVKQKFRDPNNAGWSFGSREWFIEQHDRLTQGYASAMTK